MNIIVTGGAGFIGSALIRFLIDSTSHNLMNVDKLTYAGNLDSLSEVRSNSRYNFNKVDILNRKKLSEVFEAFNPDLVFHLAAESHVDRSISGPLQFINTNVTGTAILLDVATNYWRACKGTKKERFKFQHISTDEVYGSLGQFGSFSETSSYDPSSPYSASKAASDHLVRAWNRTYGLPILITNCSNNYGPFQHAEKLIPSMIINAINGKNLPIYGDGKNVRDWLHVDDHVAALFKVAMNGKTGETYNIGANNERSNIEVVELICDIIDKKGLSKHQKDSSHRLIEFINDRPGHDFRYSIDATKLKNQIGWEPVRTFEKGIEDTVDWYFGMIGKFKL